MMNYTTAEKNHGAEATIGKTKKWIKKNWLGLVIYALAFYGLYSLFTDIGINAIYPAP